MRRRFVIFQIVRRKLDQFVDRAGRGPIQRFGKPDVPAGWSNEPLVDEALAVVFHELRQRT